MEQFQICGILFIIIFSFPIYYFINFIWKAKDQPKHVLIDSIICLSLFIFIAYITILYFYGMGASYRNYFTPLFWITFTPMPMMWILIIFYSLFQGKSKRKSNIHNDMNSDIQIANIPQKNVVKLDFLRKSFHLIFYICIWIGLLLFSYILMDVIGWTTSDYLRGCWEYFPDTTFIFFNLIKDPTTGNHISLFHAFFIVLFVCLSYGFTILEIARHSRYIKSPTTRLLNKYMRENEIEEISNFIHFFYAATFAAIILPPLLTLCTIGISLCGDLLASQFGMRWGKMHIPFNKKKTWLGTFAGTIGSFIISTIFIGPTFGLVGALAFFLTDIFTEKPIHIPDNLLTPLLITIAFILTNIAGLNYIFPSFLYK